MNFIQEHSENTVLVIYTSVPTNQSHPIKNTELTVECIAELPSPFTIGVSAALAALKEPGFPRPSHSPLTPTAGEGLL